MTSTYDKLKDYGGRRYKGMTIGRSHKWNYDPGVWREKKVTPDKWEVSYEVIKRRAGRAPEGSGAPVGTSHHWYILADQTVTKLDANSYTTDLKGVKYMLAYKSAGKETWSASERAQRRKLVKILRAMIEELEQEPAETVEAAEAPPAKPPRVRATKAPTRRVKKRAA